jgi:hypothetical protein
MTSEAISINKAKKNITVEINYSNVHPSRTVVVNWEEGRTALEVLQTVAKVGTHPVGNHVIVFSIDDLAGKRGKMAWYYTVNGKSPDKVAYSTFLKDGDYVKWIYKKDVCSRKVDK